MNTTLIDCVYVLNLERCTDRKEHMNKELQRVGIYGEKVKFFRAVSHEDDIVSQWIDSGKARSSGRPFTRRQVANWLSFRGMWQDMVTCNYNVALLLEDDVKFTAQAHKVFDRLLTKQYLESVAKVDLKEPLLIGLGAGYQHRVHDVAMSPKLQRQNPLGPWGSNPGYLLNLPMAKVLLHNSRDRLQHTSDNYTHFDMAPHYQHLYALPQPIYDLSWNPAVKQFPSTLEDGA